MIKFKLTGDKGVLLGFGLSEENVKRLKQGKPIAFDLADMLGVKGEVLIFYGNTEAEISKTLKPFIGKETVIHIEGDSDARKH